MSGDLIGNAARTSEEAIRRARLLADDLGRPQEALEVLADAIAGDPENAQLWTLRAWAHLRLRNWDEAIEAATVAARNDPGNEWAFRIMSAGWRRRRHYPRAVAAAREAVRLAPHNPSTHAVLGEALSKTVTSWRAAGRAMARALELAPNDPGILSAAGSAALSRRRPRLAETYYRRALALRPDDAAIRNDLALAQGRSLRFRSAVLGYTDALAINPNQQLSYTNIAAAASAIALIVYPLVFACAMIAANTNPHIPFMLPFVAAAGWEIRGDGWRLVKVIVPAVNRKGGTLPFLTFGIVIVVGWMLAIPFLPEDAGRYQAQTLAGLDLFPTVHVVAGYIRWKLS